MQVNKISFPTYKHLKVNHTEIRDEEILKGFDLLYASDLNPIEVKDKEIKRQVQNTDGWAIEGDHFIVLEGGQVQNGIIFTGQDKQAQRLKIELQKNAKAKLFFLYDLKGGDLLADVEFIVNEGAELEMGMIFLEGHHIYYNIHSHLKEKNAKMHMEAAYYAGDGSNYDMNLEVIHDSKETESLLNMNGVLDDGASKLYKYNIDFPKGCYGSKGEETETVIAVGDDFKNVTVPILLVGEDSIEAAHGATLKQPDERTIDYISSRGIDRDTATLMVVEGHFKPAMDMMDKDTKDLAMKRLEEIIRGR